MSEFFKDVTQKKVEAYESLEDFVAGVSRTVSPNIKLKNIKILFFYFGVILMLVSLVRLTAIFLFKHQRAINGKIVRCSLILLQELFPRTAIDSRTAEPAPNLTQDH